MIAEPNIIADEILTFANGDESNFSNWPQSIAEAAECWANVVDVCALGVIPASTTGSVARAGFISTFLNMTIESHNGAQVFSDALMVYATQLATGMVGAGFTGAPPPTPFIFNLMGLITGSSQMESLRFAQDLVIWFKTGTAINITTGATVNWQ